MASSKDETGHTRTFYAFFRKDRLRWTSWPGHVSQIDVNGGNGSNGEVRSGMVGVLRKI